jgi:hypothetical protein
MRSAVGLGVPSFERRRTVIANDLEKEAIVHFVDGMQAARQTRRRLFARASEEPERVLTYLDSLPDGAEHEDELIRQLRAIATGMLRDCMDLWSD